MSWFVCVIKPCVVVFSGDYRTTETFVARDIQEGYLWLHGQQLGVERSKGLAKTFFVQRQRFLVDNPGSEQSQQDRQGQNPIKVTSAKIEARCNMFSQCVQ